MRRLKLALDPLWWFAAAACLPAALLPIANPDLFWHLSAASRLFTTGTIPREEWLSWTLAGEPWIDFEWLAQAMYGAAFSAWGLAGLWGLKALLVAIGAWRLNAWMTLYAATPELRALGVAVWATGMLPRADIRPELFSVLFFIELFRRLESWRLKRQTPGAIHTALFFALWANLHGGFACGLVLVALYALFGLPSLVALAAAAGTLANPWGWGVYRVILGHAGEAAQLGGISEWGPPDPRNAWRWIELGLIPVAAGAALAAARKGDPPHPAHAFVAAALAAISLRHARLAAYFVTAAVPLAALWATAGGLRLKRGTALGIMGALALWASYLGWDYGLGRRIFETRFAPERIAEHLMRQRDILGSRRLYNPWGWGGYLGWRLEGSYRIFQDGRYLFHPLLRQAGQAIASPQSWQEFLTSHGVEVAILENIPLLLPSTRRYPDGREKEMRRPYYTFYMPRERWALTYFDEKALLFVRRDAVPADWLATNEYRWLRPHDDIALADALARGEIPRQELDQESARYFKSRQ